MSSYIQDSFASICADDRLRSTVASQLAGALSTFSVCPLDTIRYRFMAQDGTAARTNNGHYYTRVSQSIRFMLREEGPLALFRGGHIAVFGATASWGLYFFLYRSGQQFVAPWVTPNTRFLVDSTVSTAASLTNATLTTPIWLIKTRMQVDDMAAYRGESRGPYRSFFGGMRHVVKTEGALALWRGLRMQLALSLANAFYVPLYELMKRRWLTARGVDRLTTSEIMGCTALARCTLAFLTNPFFVIRTRLQDPRFQAVNGVEYTTVLATARLTYRREGIGGFFRGVGPSLMLTAPRSALFMVLLERVDEQLKSYATMAAAARRSA